MVNILSAGACKGLFQALFAKHFKSGKLQGEFGAVDAMQERLLAGHACELIVLTRLMLEKLAIEGWVIKESITDIGKVGTGIAIPKKLHSVPDVSHADVLRVNLLAATSLHFPDPQHAAVGIHFQNVLLELGILEEVRARCLHYANGALAMAELAKNKAAHGDLQVGCTQLSEITYTKGVLVVAELPEPYQLRTTYAAALTPSGIESKRALKMLEKFTSDKHLKIRQQGGFIL